MASNLDIPIKNTSKIVSRWQTTGDIAKYMLIAERDSRKYHKQLKDYFDTGDDLETAKKIHEFARKELIYTKEPPSKQIVRTAPRVISDIYVDCKGYSSFILASLQACGIDSFYRLAGYRRDDKNPTHVYCVGVIDGEEIVIDGTIRKFGYEAPATHRYNLKPLKKKTMSLAYVQGSEIGRKSKAEKKKKKEDRKAKHDKNKDERKDKVKKKVAKIGAAPARAAFFLILKVNGFKLATKLAKAVVKDKAMVQSFWAKCGGNWDDLVKRINEKSKEPAISEPVTMTAALATATPILIAVGALLKNLNLQSKEEEEELDKGIADGEETIANDPDFEKKTMLVDKDAKLMKVKSKDVQEDLSPSDDSSDDGEEDNSMIWIIGLGLAAVMFMKK
ncbi:hypothetical protein CCP1ISM_250010 [Azospirillaceae bacterium]